MFTQDNKDVLKLILGKHNLSAPMTSYSRPEVVVKSQSYFFTHSVKAMAVTQTAKGITSKQLLIGTIGDQVCCLDFHFHCYLPGQVIAIFLPLLDADMVCMAPHIYPSYLMGN